MATAQVSQNRVYLFRLQTLIIDGGTTVVRNIFYEKSANVPLNILLHNEKATINRLRASKTITRTQFDLLYPQNGQSPTTADFDLTLSICLLRNLKCCGLNKHFAWSAIPQAVDTSLEADICRLRMFRNEIAHISSTTSITQNTFTHKWLDIEQVLNRLNACVQNPVQNLQQQFNEYKNSPLDEEAEKRIDGEIKKWRKFEKGLESEVKLVKKDIQEVKHEVGIVQAEVYAVTENVGNIKEEVHAVTEKFGNVEDKISGVEKHVTKEIYTVTEKVDNVKKEVHEVTEKVHAVQEKIDEFETEKRAQGGSKKAVGKAPNFIQRFFERRDRRRKMKKMKDELAAFYKTRYSTIPLSPLFEENDTPLVDFYILPEMNFLKKKPGGEETKTHVKSLSEVFKSEKSCEIYLTADAGFGKTAFSKYLAITWCQAHRPEMKYKKYFEEDAINTMLDFEFLFLVLLRDSSYDCSIDDLIMNQIMQNLSRPFALTTDFLQEILHRKRYLVILDGLDEWIHPEKKCAKVPKTIPHRNAREKCVILTTTRPWKLGVLNLKTSEIDKKVELVKLTSESAKTLEERTISKIKNMDIAEAKILAKELNVKIKENKLEDLESVPLLTMYLICLWCDNIPLGQSKCGLYASIIELLLSRTISRRPEMKLTFEPSQSDIPQCFSEHEHCTKYCTYLNALGQLAFKTLFSETMESTLVFNQSVADKYLSPNYLKLSLDSGILTQSTEKTVTKKFYKCSFSHKTVQEFLCALYISCQNESDIKNIVLKKCKSLQSILDMSTVFVFVSGMNEEIMSSVSREWISVISEDKITGAYRSTADYDVYEEHPLKDIQDMYISCIKENTSDKELKLFCQDFFFSGDCKEENYLSNLTRLAADNRGNIETINIDTRHGPSLREVIDKCALFELFNISKVYFYGKGEDAILLLPVLMNRSSKCVTVRLPFPLRGSWTREMSKTLQNNSLLQAIYIDCFMMSHDVLNDFLNYMINRKSMKEIKLSNIFCAEHRTSCGAEFKLDFSQHSDLRTLALHDIPVSQVKVNASLEDYHIGRVNSGLMTSYLRNLPAASQLQTFACGYQKSSGDVASMLQTLQSLVEVKHIALYDSNLEGRILSPKMVIIELVLLDNVTMPASTFRDLVKVVEKLSHQVKVKIYTSIIEPRTEFEDIKQYIYSSEYFRVLHYDNRGNFVFETEVESHITD